MDPVRLGKFWLVDKVAAGGMAEIYKGVGMLMDGRQQTLAIKKILPQYSTDEEFISMLVDEAKVMVHLNHPNIVPIMEFGKFEDSYYIAMEYVDGPTLKGLFSKCREAKFPFPVDMAVHIIREVGTALAYAHRKSDEKGKSLGIVHRDISPTNILLSYEGDVKLTDFGIAKASNQSHRTQIGVIRGKTGYMSPEQTRSGTVIDQRSDIYSLGIILFELLTGERLYRADSVPEALKLIRKGEIPSITQFRPEVTPNLEAIVRKALAVNPEDRYGRAEEFVDALNEFLTRLAPGGRPVRVTHSDVAGFLHRFFSSEIESRKGEITSIAFDELNTVAESAESIVTRTPIRAPIPQTIAQNPLYELSNPEGVALTGPTYPSGPDVAPTASSAMGTESLQNAVSASIRIATKFSPLLIAGFLAGVGVIGILYFMIRSPRSPSDAAKVGKPIQVEIRSEPKGAQIWKDGERLDEPTPTQVALLLGKRTRISLTKTGYESKEEEIVATEGMPPLLFVLQKEASATPVALQRDGVLKVSTSPMATVKVYVDGTPVITRKTPLDLQLEPGRSHTVRIEPQGAFDSAEKVFTVDSGKEVGWSFNLSPRQVAVRPTQKPPKVDPPVKLGSPEPPIPVVLGVTREQVWAFVAVDRGTMQETPATFDLEPGRSHEVQVFAQNSKPVFKKKIFVPKGRKSYSCQFDLRARTGACQ